MLFLFDESDISHAPEYYYLTTPDIDSWDKLLDDLDRVANARKYESCIYFGNDASSCSSCIAAEQESCGKAVMRDIASRIRKLMGEDE